MGLTPELILAETAPPLKALEAQFGVDSLPALAAAVEQGLCGLEPGVAEALRSRLDSEMPRRAFQAYSDLAAAILVQRSGGVVLASDCAGHLRVSRAGGEAMSILVLSFVHGQGWTMDSESLSRLRGALSRVATELRYAVFVRRPLVSDFRAEPVRQAVELWLREVQGGRWRGEYATYEDEQVHLEFGLTGERVQHGENPLAMVVGPFLSSRMLQALESRVVQGLDRHLVREGDGPVLVVCVADRPWKLGPAHMREFLCGRPKWITSPSRAEEGPWEACLGPQREPCLFKDPAYGTVTGVVLMGASHDGPQALVGRAWSNPFSPCALGAQEISMATLGCHQRVGEDSVMRWYKAHDKTLEIGA